MPTDSTTIPPTPISRPQKSKILPVVTGIFLFCLSVGSAFVGGYYFNEINKQTVVDIPTTTPLSSSQPLPVLPDEKLISETVIEPGLGYYDDTVIAVTNDNPRKILIATATRQETEQGANQNTRVSFFDGQTWNRKVLAQSYPTSGIYTNSLISDWQIDIDPSRLLKQSVLGKINIENNTLNFDTGVITNNIGVRSLPGYTKFISNNDGNLTVNDSSLPAKIIYTRIYSNNSKEIQFYTSPLGLTTHWLAFWDENGNFYHVDSTTVEKPTDIYKSHKFAVMVDKSGRISKSFDVDVNYSNEQPPNTYQINLGSPINKNITFNIGKSINKAPNNSHVWYMSEGIGKADNISGYGIIEYIHD